MARWDLVVQLRLVPQQVRWLLVCLVVLVDLVVRQVPELQMR
jgi:hypothetical protein